MCIRLFFCAFRVGKHFSFLLHSSLIEIVQSVDKQLSQGSRGNEALPSLTGTSRSLFTCHIVEGQGMAAVLQLNVICGDGGREGKRE